MSLRGGIDLGGTKIQTVVVDEAGEVRSESRVPTPREGVPADVADAMAEAMNEATGEEGITAVGVGSPGAVDAAAGTVTNAGNLPGWEGSFPLAEELHKRLGVPVRLDNDVTVAVEGERQLGAGRGFDSFLGVFWGTGVGGGLVLGGRLWEGRGAAGEIGHVVVREDGDLCPCGRRGCMEAYAGRGALEQRARKAVDEGRETVLFEIMEERGRDRLTSGIWSRALKREDALATELIDRAVEAIGTAVASALNVIDVEAVVIGGGLGLKLGEPYAERIKAAMMPHLFADDRPPEVRLAELGDLGGAVGAALLAER